MSLIRKAFKRLHYPVDIIAQCVRWYLAYSLSLRNQEEIMAERGIIVDHSTLHRWVIRLVPLLDKAFRRHKRTAGRRWRMDETYIKMNVAPFQGERHRFAVPEVCRYRVPFY
ncbi:IS66 family transposase, partial [Enterobacter cloacae]|uniref:IS66 family transposase n=2 Tax=Enterobacter cloacae TaxID=550 RepID=UPI0021ADCFBD